MWNSVHIRTSIVGMGVLIGGPGSPWVRPPRPYGPSPDRPGMALRTETGAPHITSRECSRPQHGEQGSGKVAARGAAAVVVSISPSD